jgi:hypothetical protein
LRGEGNKELLNKVKDLYLNLIDRLDVKDREAFKHDFSSLVAECHALRLYRNNLLHSAFIELEAGGEVVTILQSNPKVKIDQASGDLLFDQEELTERSILEHLHKVGDLAFRLGQCYLQLIHWSPF